MTSWRGRRERRLAALERYRIARRIADEDLTVLGEQLAELHVDTLTDDLDVAAREDYREALGSYDRAKALLQAAEQAQTLEAVLAVSPAVTDARFHRACVLARVGGTDLPTRRDPCFFNPHHGPAVADLAWAPPDGVRRDISVCPACRARLAGGEAPDVRVIRVGDRWVPWWESGGSTDRVVRHHAHVVRGGAWHTDAAITEAYIHAGIDAPGWYGGGL